MRVNFFFRVLRDAELEKKGIEVIRLLTPTDKVSLILGFKGLLAEFAHHFDFRTSKAYIDTRKLKR